MNTRRILVVAVCAVISAASLHVILRSLREAAPITRFSIAPGRVPAVDRALRPNYPYSVIPGGAYSPAELRFATRRDPLVERHYADFDVNSARLVVLTANRYQYASFRMRDHIFWTRHRLFIPKGEVLLTDGRSYARTRCGNRLSDTAQPDTTPLQPSDSLLSLPPFRPELLSKGPLELASGPPPGELAQEHPVLPFEAPRLAPYLPNETEAGLRMPETFAPLGGLWPTSIAGPTHPTTPTNLETTPPTFTLTPPEVVAEIPEPASLLLFGLVLCVSGLLLGRMVHANRRREEPPKRSLGCRAREGETSLRR